MIWDVLRILITPTTNFNFFIFFNLLIIQIYAHEKGVLDHWPHKKVDFDLIKFEFTARFRSFFMCIYLQIFVNFFANFMFTLPIVKPPHLSWQWTSTSLRCCCLWCSTYLQLPQSNPTCSKALGSFLLTESPSIALPRSVVFPSVVRQVWELVRKVWGSLMDEWICICSRVLLFCPQSWGSRESKLRVCSHTCARQSWTPELSYGSLRHTSDKIPRFLSQHPALLSTKSTIWEVVRFFHNQPWFPTLYLAFRFLWFWTCQEYISTCSTSLYQILDCQLKQCRESLVQC